MVARPRGLESLPALEKLQNCNCKGIAGPHRSPFSSSNDKALQPHTGPGWRGVPGLEHASRKAVTGEPRHCREIRIISQ